MGAAAVATEAFLDIQESVSVGTAGKMRSDGLIPIHVIRPGVGKGKGRHLYEAKMLEENAHIFKGWKMFVDHQAPEAKRASGGLPRSLRDIGGLIKETWWDGSVPADPDRGHGQGAVVALCRPTRLIHDLIETDPSLVEASISAQATAVRPVTVGGQTAWLVEGFQPEGSVDWVSRAGAGGRVVQLAEALEESWTPEQEADELFAVMAGSELLERLRVTRPDIYPQVLAEATAAAANDPGANELRETHDHEEDDMELKDIVEALSTEEGKAAVAPLVGGIVKELVEAEFQRIAAPALAELVEEALSEERELIQAESNAQAGRKLKVRDMRDAAHAKIDEARLPDTFKTELKARFDLVEGEPTPDLDVADEKDEEGKTVKTADEKLDEKVQEAIDEKAAQYREIAPTSVRGQGPAKAAKPEDAAADTDDTEKKGVVEAEKNTTGSRHTDELLEAAGVVIDEDLYKDIIEV